MNSNQRFIAFDLKEKNDTDTLISSLLSKSIELMNEKANNTPSLFSKMKGSDVETFSYNSMCEIAPSVSLDPETIKLVSGHTFPDIIIEKTTYGVEIKSTQKDAWTSTGSSIVESTRFPNTERIFMLFGKLGGGTPEFRCKPYQLCLSNIAVTHSPRYLIDMCLTKDDNIFNKLKTDYDTFRNLTETEKINCVRQYFKKRADKIKRERKKYEMPWWLGEITNVNLRFFADIDKQYKNELISRMFILFLGIFGIDKDKYKPVALWLCSRYSLLCSNLRDEFTAGGKVDKLGEQHNLDKPCPQIVNQLYNRLPNIINLLNYPDDELIEDINDFWQQPYNKHDLLNSWIKALQETFNNNNELKDINIEEIIRKDFI